MRNNYTGVPFKEVLKAELNEIEKARAGREEAVHPGRARAVDARRASESSTPTIHGAGGPQEQGPAGSPGIEDQIAVYKRAHQEGLVGLAFSGGGIRSATFNLGVLQGLAELGLLSKFDYLSTVSGGGYIGSWLAAFIWRRGLKHVESELRAACVEQAANPTQSADEGDRPGIRFLRQYSNYLTPRKGLFGTDTWTAIATYLRNLILNLIILVLGLTALLILPRIAVHYYRWIGSSLQSWSLLVVAFFLSLVAVTAMVANLSNLFSKRLTSRTPTRPATDSAQAAQSAEADAPFYTRLSWIQALIVFPILLTAWFVATALWPLGKMALHNSLTEGWFKWAWGSGAAYALLWVLGWAIGEAQKQPAPAAAALQISVLAKFKILQRLAGVSLKLTLPFVDAVRDLGGGTKRYQDLGKIVLAGFGAATVGGVLLRVVVAWLGRWSPDDMSVWHAATWGMPMVLLVFLSIGVLHVGLAGRAFSEEAREWWSRLGASLLRWTIALGGLFGLTIYGPLALTQVGVWVQAGLASGWLLSTGAGILAGKSSSTRKGQGSFVLEMAGKVAPPVFVLGLLLLLASFTSAILPGYVDQSHDFVKKRLPWLHRYVGEKHDSQGTTPENAPAFSTGGSWFAHSRSLYGAAVADEREEFWERMNRTLDGCLWLCFAGFLGLALGISSRVGINDFSMHAMYRNRLVRCYLGAVNFKRNQLPFTGFDPEDDCIPVRKLGYDGPVEPPPAPGKRGNPDGHCLTPYPIINTALNLVQGDNLAWQSRKAASFVFTPKYCGYEVPPDKKKEERKKKLEDYGYRPTYGGTGKPSYGGSVTLGTAMAISGAAASPNMGYHTSAALAFLMTVFNVRLGWWLGNPRHPKTWGKRGPGWGLSYLLWELLGRTNDKRGYVYLSDGGHFENLGIYELVRRRCRFIVACDAGEDHEVKFGDLGNAIEKCRTDFGVDIDIKLDPLRQRKETGKSESHCAVGTIHYDHVDEGAPVGTLVYLKSSLTGDEPADVQRYAAQNPNFPHQSTADQWFDEPQFESYRALGHHVVEKVFGAIGNEKELEAMGIEALLIKLRQRWYPPSAAVGASFTKHTATYSRLLEEMRKVEDLEFLGQQVFPEWPSLIRPAAGSPEGSLWLPAKESERRAGFYFCNQVIQLMEDAYVDLKLEEEYDHPDNRGWMNLFRHWAWSGMFCATWAISAGIYGARFQRFCERHLDLRLGNIQSTRPGDKLLNSFDENEGPAFWQKVMKDQGLSSWEVELVQAFLGWGRSSKDHDKLSELQILPFQVAVESARLDGQPLRFTVGFALAQIAGTAPGKAEIWYFRIQHHLRKMGLARQALQELMRKYEVENKVEVAPGEIKGKAGRPARGSSKEEALPTEESVRLFKQLFDSVKYGRRQDRVG